MKIKSILLLLLGVTIIVTIHSCSQQNNNNLAGNYLQFTVGSKSYKAKSFIQEFDDDNLFDIKTNNLVRGMSGYIDGPGDWFTYDVYVNKTLTKVESIRFLSTGGGNGGYFGQGTCSSNNQPLNVNLSITRNDNVTGGIIEGSFSGTVGSVATTNTVPTSTYCSGTQPINGSFKMKIK